MFQFFSVFVNKYSLFCQSFYENFIYKRNNVDGFSNSNIIMLIAFSFKFSFRCENFKLYRFHLTNDDSISDIERLGIDLQNV